MQKKLFESFIGKQVELFMAPNMPVTAGILKSCDEDFIVIGNEVWSYKAILGIRPITTPTLPFSNEREEEKAVHQPEAAKTEPEAAKTKQKTEIATSQPQSSEKSSTADVPVSPSEPAPSKEVKPEKTEKTVKPEKPENDDAEKQPEIKIPDREFAGILTVYYANRHWGFIESEEVLRTGVPLRDGKRIFFHLNQITDAALREKLQREKLVYPSIDVVFRLIPKQQGVAADDVREAVHVKIADVVIPIESKPEKNEPPQKEQKVQESETAENVAENAEANTEAVEQKAPADTEGQETQTSVEETTESPYETGEIDYYSRYGNPPHGKIRIKGNQLFHFEDIDVIDPVLAVFLEVSPSAEGQAVKFTKYTDPRGRVKAENVEAATPFPEDKLKSWADLIEKAKKRMKQG